MRNEKGKKQLQGFSLSEIVLTIALLLTIGAFLFPTSVGNLQKNKVKEYASQIVTDIRYQQQRARYKNIPTGVYFRGGEYTLFDGESFASGTEKDTKTLPNNINIPNFSLTNGNSVLFPAGEFRPNSYGYIVIGTIGYSTRVNVNMEGVIESD